MSVVGISPSDIINGFRAVSHGIQALRERDGSKERFRQTSRNCQSRIDALEALDDYALSLGSGQFSDATRHAVQGVLGQELVAQAGLDKYSSKLGQQATLGRRRGVPAKLRWAFGGAHEQQERDARSAPGIDATILTSIL